MLVAVILTFPRIAL